MSKRVALYLRVSTKDQTTANQRIELERWATARGYDVVGVYEDHGVSGAKGRDKRPQFDQALKDATRRKFDVFAAWDVSRIGRSLPHLIDTLGELHAAGVDLYLHQQGLDTTTPSGRAMFGMSAVFAEYERAMTIERIHAGLGRARTNGTRSGKRIGRPGLPYAIREAAIAALRRGASIRQAVKESGASVGAVGAMRARNWLLLARSRLRAAGFAVRLNLRDGRGPHTPPTSGSRSRLSGSKGGIVRWLAPCRQHPQQVHPSHVRYDTAGGVVPP